MDGDAGSNYDSSYGVRLCNQVVLCKSAADAGVHAIVCSGTWSNGIPRQGLCWGPPVSLASSTYVLRRQAEPVRRAVTELTTFIGAPTKHAARRHQYAGVILVSADCLCPG